MAAEFLPAYTMRGFDRHNVPRWQMVPAGGERWVILRGRRRIDRHERGASDGNHQ